jgi:enolase
MVEIRKIQASEILDSRGNPTIMCVVNDKTAAVPSGASTGEWEAVELRDGDKSRYNGKGVLKAVNNVNKIIAPKIVGKMDASEQVKIDRFLCQTDGTNNKAKLGANAILAVSLGCMYVGAKKQEPYKYIAKIYKTLGGKTTGRKLPVPSFNIINGGAHADSGIDCQEFMIQPKAATFAERLRMGAEITATLKKILVNRGLVTAVGDEGGFAPRIATGSPITGAIELITKAIEEAGYQPVKDVTIALDIAASEFYNTQTKKYEMKGEQKSLTTDEYIGFIVDLVRKYPIIKSIEDPLDQNDWDGYVEITKRLGKKITLVGDDFFVTNKERLAKGIKMGACNAILIKLNQIGTLTETLETIALAKANKYKIMISHRSGETSDTIIADLAVAVDAEFIKSGAPVRGERVCKYNRLMIIEKDYYVK